MEGDFVISWFSKIEIDLQRFLKDVPYCNEHEKVWSPCLANVILEACSILDSVWRFSALQSPCVKSKDLGIRKYFQYFGQELGPRWTILREMEPVQIKPFDNWNKSSYTAKDYDDLDWWNTHNKLKHDRIKNIKEATLNSAITAVGGLFLAIIKSGFCKEAMVNERWIDSGNVAYTDEDFQSVHLSHALVESRLYSYPIGWWDKKIKRLDKWQHPGRNRFIKWFDDYESPP